MPQTPLTTRKPMSWRIPFDTLERVQRVQGDRTFTDCVVQALELWVRTQKPQAKSRRRAR